MKYPRLLRLVLLCAAMISVAALSEQMTTADLQEAHQFNRQAKYEEAKQIYKRWLDQHPDDARVCFSYGYTFYLQACSEDNEVKAVILRKQAYAWVTKAKKLGDKEALAAMVLSGMDENGNESKPAYSSNVKANAFIAAGEKAFTKGNIDEAFQRYQDALAVDPVNYLATLFSGDIYFNKEDYKNAILWFSKAVDLQPNVETAYRYWGDALLHQNLLSEARDKYIEAVIAEPYNQMPREMLQHFATLAKIQLARPDVRLPMVTVGIQDGKTVIGCDPKADPLVFAYAVARAKWLTEDGSHYFEKDWSPRHSLPEEAAGLRAFCKIAGEMSQKDPASTKPWESTVASIKSLDQAGLLEAFVLLNRADTGIAKDYEAYRLEHRDVLIRYAQQIWFGANQAQP